MIDKILITTSGIGSRLGDLTDYTNKSLVRVGNKPAISHIIDNYPNTCEFIVTLGHYGDLVKQFLTLTYPKHNFTFVEVDNFSGPGSSLGYSILKAKQYLQSPFIFNACDTLMSDNLDINKALNMKSNFCMGGMREDVSQYSTLLTSGDRLMEIKKKGEINFDLVYIGLAGIFNYELFFENLSCMYERDSHDSSLNEGLVINNMLNHVDFTFLKTTKWLDIGNVGELEKARKFFGSEADVLEKKEESIYFFNDFVVKFFSDIKICHNRVMRADILSDLTPRMIGSTKNFYMYEKVDGALLSDVINKKKFIDLLEWSNEHLWHDFEVKNFYDLCYEFYINKTKKRVAKFLENNSESSHINGEILPSVWNLLDSVDIEWLCNGKPVRFHGDFILDNILETQDGFCLLDWRQDFANQLDCGDIYYDFAKLNHNLVINHEIVNKKLYNENPDNCYILCNSKLLECRQLLKDFVETSGYDYKKVEILTALIWLNMSPLHEYPFNKFLFNFGKYKLSKVLSNEC